MEKIFFLIILLKAIHLNAQVTQNIKPTDFTAPSTDPGHKKYISAPSNEVQYMQKLAFPARLVAPLTLKDSVTVINITANYYDNNKSYALSFTIYQEENGTNSNQKAIGTLSTQGVMNNTTYNSLKCTISKSMAFSFVDNYRYHYYICILPVYDKNILNTAPSWVDGVNRLAVSTVDITSR